MGNSIQVSIDTNADIEASTLQVTFQNGKGSRPTDGRYCNSVTLVAGEQPSFATVKIPVAEFGDEVAPTVALMSSGPTGKILLRTRASVKLNNGANGYGATQPLLSGTLVQYGHDIANDAAFALIVDDKWILSKITTFGCYVYDPEAQRFYFDSARELVFNAQSLPDCVDAPGGIVAFAPTRKFGYKQDYKTEDYVEPVPGKATTQARSWRVNDALQYLRQVHALGSSTPIVPMGAGDTQLPKYIIWPETLSQVFGSQRTLKNVSIDNHSLLQAITVLVRKAGAYELFMKANDEYSSTMTIVNMNPAVKTSGNLYLPSYSGATVGELMSSSSVVLGGYVNESIMNYFDRVCICGDPPAIERMLSMDNTNDDTGGILLEPAWSTADEAAFKAFCSSTTVTGTTANTASRFQLACSRWPYVFAAYRVAANGNLWKDTKWKDYVNGGKHARFLPHALTGQQENGSDPRNWELRQIIVEYQIPGSTQWQPSPKYDGASLSPDREIIFLDALRDVYLHSWSNSLGNSAQDPRYNGDTMRKNNIRINIGVEADFRTYALTSRAYDPNNTSNRVFTDDVQFTYLSVAGPRDYIDWIRQKSYPEGKAQMPSEVTAAYPDRDQAGKELFSDIGDGSETNRIVRHAMVRAQDVRRIEYSGTVIMPNMNCSIIPGQNVTLESRSPIGTYSVVRSVTFDSDEQVSILELAAHDQRVIYDIPLASPAKTSKGTESSTGSQDYGTVSSGEDASYDSSYSTMNSEPDETATSRPVQTREEISTTTLKGMLFNSDFAPKSSGSTSTSSSGDAIAPRKTIKNEEEVNAESQDIRDRGEMPEKGIYGANSIERSRQDAMALGVGTANPTNPAEASFEPMSKDMGRLARQFSGISQ